MPGCIASVLGRRKTRRTQRDRDLLTAREPVLEIDYLGGSPQLRPNRCVTLSTFGTSSFGLVRRYSDATGARVPISYEAMTIFFS